MADFDETKAIDPKIVKLREQDFPTAMCGNCRYFGNRQTGQFCDILVQDVQDTQVCDAWQGRDTNPLSYDIADEDFLAFVEGMVIDQPYQHIVQYGLDTPVGLLVVIQDTMKPMPHIFSLTKAFHLQHTSSEHAWTQEEADRTTEVGRSGQASGIT